VIKHFIILAAGQGTKIWPYNEIRNKVMLPIANKPVIAYNVDSLIELEVNQITIITNNSFSGIQRYFTKYKNVNCISIKQNSGTAETLLEAFLYMEDCSDFVVLYGDTIIHKNDLEKLIKSNKNTVLTAPLREHTGNVIGTSILEGKISGIIGHPREGISHRFAGFHFDATAVEYIKNTPDFMTDIQVGMMPIKERFIESAVADMIRDGIDFNALETQNKFYDIDKPWHILEANEGIVKQLCRDLKSNELAKDASIDSTADIRGFVKLGKRSRVGRNVIIQGNIIVGDDTVIDNGALIQGEIIAGDNVFIGNCCFVAAGSSIGDDCYLGHACEFWGLLMKRIYLYHYMEMFGIIGENTDIGAGTVCGTLRFDDGKVTHKVKGRREIPYCYDDAIYLGDYTRTGVNAIIQPGIKTGVYSLVGPGVLLNKDLPSRKSVFLKQELEYKEWGPERYGW